MHPTSARFLELALDFLWGQWTAIGIGGVGESHSSVVDPEALVVGTAILGQRDPRLFDEMLDWLVLNSAWVDLVRLKRMADSAPTDTQRVLAAVGDFVGTHRGSRRWRRLLEGNGSEDVQHTLAGATPLFAVDKHDRETWGDLDNTFLRYGLKRNRPILRGMSKHPDGASPPCLRFRARGLTGVGARAEVLTYLWTHEWAHGRLIAERTLYAKTAVAEYLGGLSTSGLASRKKSGRRVLYRLNRQADQLGQPSCQYVDWTSALQGMALVWEELQSWQSGVEDDHARTSRLVQVLRSAETQLAAEGFEIDMPDLRGWARRNTKLPFRVVDELGGRLETFTR